MGKIAIFGGTGMTGECAVDHALKIGKNVRLLYRTEETVQRFKDKVELVKGDVTNLADVEKTLEGTDAVCVVLGTRNSLEPTTVLSTGMQNIIDGMKTHQLTKVSVCLSSFLFWEPEKVPKQFEHLNAEHKKMMDLLKPSGLDFIAVHPPHIANEPSGEFKIAYGESPGGRVISKYDLGKFLIDSLDQSEHYGKIVGICKV
ncbi:flavin reductase (NADPH) [Bradysia coprophila]|uniref:flavin reductase (NADPH) n=1 Tax=Bradysia coprophila TaxID=38358 RepID=UPI00187DBB1F|nr:flavin reductase (NADPH) [Bradysia coprophila]